MVVADQVGMEELVMAAREEGRLGLGMKVKEKVEFGEVQAEFGSEAEMVEFRGMVWPEMVVVMRRRRRKKGRIVISLLDGHGSGNDD